jgi:hypothetical protein
MRENIPPLIEDMSVKSKEEWGWCGIIPCVTHSWTEIRVRIFDVSSYTVEIKVLDNGKYETFSGWGNQTFNAFIDIDYWADILLDYKVRVTAVDKAGNELVMEKEIEGFFGGILEFLADIWDAIVGAVMAAWEAVVAALNWLLDLIIEAITAIANAALVAVESAIVGYVRGVKSVMESAIGMPLEDFGTTAEEIARALMAAITYSFSSGLYYALVGLALALLALEVIIAIYTIGASQLASQLLSNCLVPIIVAALIGAFALVTSFDESSTLGGLLTAVGLSAGLVAGVTTVVWFVYREGRKSLLGNAFGEIFGLGLTILGAVLILLPVSFSGFGEFMLDCAGAVLGFYGIWNVKKSQGDKVSSVLRAAEIISYVSMGAGLISMYAANYFD